MTLEAGSPSPWPPGQSFGWTHLLPPLTGLRLMCIDDSGALTAWLTRKALHVTQLRWSEADRTWESPSAGATSTTAASLAPPLFDGFLVHDPDGSLADWSSADRIEQLLRTLSSSLTPNAFVYMGVRNAWSLRRLLGRGNSREPHASSSAASIAGVKRRLRQFGFGIRHAHPYLLERGHVVEVLLAHGFRSTKNRELPRERIKERIFGRYGSRLFADAYGVVATRGPREPSVLDLLLRRTDVAAKQFLVFAGHKAIVSAGPADSSAHDSVTVMVADELSHSRRLGEIRTLERLATLAPRIATQIPKVLDRFEIDGVACIVMTRLAGVTLDADVKSLEPVTDAALAFLIELHRSTSRPTLIGDDEFGRLFGELFDSARERNRALSDDLHGLQSAVANIVLHRELPTVWVHGDFKIENVMYDFTTLDLTGVIDWEHALIPGLPYLDVFYLLIYNRSIRGSDWIDGAFDLFVRQRQTDSERAKLKRYGDVIAMPPEFMPALAAMFVAHHIGRRLHLPQDPPLQERVRGLVCGLTAQCLSRR